MYNFDLVSATHAKVLLSAWSLASEAQWKPLAEQFNLLDASERERFHRYRRAEPAQRFVAARWGLRTQLGNWLNEPPNSIRLGTTPLGKPWLLDYPDCHFSLSHSGDRALLAISHMPVGVDIEAILEPHRITPTLVNHALTQSEAELLESTAATEKAELFTHHWVCKEAVMKAVGLGCQLEPKHISIDLEASSVELAPAWMCQMGNDWCVELLDAPAGYCAALAIEIPF